MCHFPVQGQFQLAQGGLKNRGVSWNVASLRRHAGILSGPDDLLGLNIISI